MGVPENRVKHLSQASHIDANILILLTFLCQIGGGLKIPGIWEKFCSFCGKLYVK